jgi:hypothetical protein
MTTTIIIRKTDAGLDIVRHKTHGTEKGETHLATVCGGLLGRVLAINTARIAVTFCAADDLVYEGPDGSRAYGQSLIEAIAAEEVAA